MKPLQRSLTRKAFTRSVYWPLGFYKSNAGFAEKC